MEKWESKCQLSLWNMHTFNKIIHEQIPLKIRSVTRKTWTLELSPLSYLHFYTKTPEPLSYLPPHIWFFTWKNGNLSVNYPSEICALSTKSFMSKFPFKSKVLQEKLESLKLVSGYPEFSVRKNHSVWDVTIETRTLS